MPSLFGAVRRWLVVSDTALRPRSQEMLRLLQANHQRLVTKDELFEAIWPGRIVTDQSLFQCIAEIRAVHGKTSIQTYSGRGYQWRGPVPGSAPRWAAVLLGALGLIAVIGSQVTGTPKVPEPPSIAVVALGDEPAVDVQRWVRRHLPSRVVERDAVLVARRSIVNNDPLAGDIEILRRVAEAVEADLSMGVVLRPTESGWAADYRLVSDGFERAGTVHAARRDELTRDLGQLLAEVYSSVDLERLDGNSLAVRMHRQALRYLMAGEARQALPYLAVAFDHDPEHLPTRLTRLRVLLATSRIDEASADADAVWHEGQSGGRSQWLVYGALMRAEVASRSGVEDARAWADQAYQRAIGLGQDRLAGKAATLLGDLALREHQVPQARDWYLTAHGLFVATR